MTKIGVDVAALTKLVETLGPEFELQLQQAVIENFAHKHVKAFIDKDVKEVLIKNAILEHIGELRVQWQVGRGNATQIIPSESFKSALDLLRADIVSMACGTKEAFLKECQQQAAAVLDGFKKEVSANIQAHVERTVKTMVEADISFRVKDAVKKKLEEIHKAAEI